MYSLKQYRNIKNFSFKKIFLIFFIFVLYPQYNVFANTWGNSIEGGKSGNGINYCTWGKSMASNQAMYYPDEELINQSNSAYFNPQIYVYDWKRRGENCKKLYKIKFSPRGTDKCVDDGTGTFHRSFFARCVPLKQEDVNTLVDSNNKKKNRSWIAATVTGDIDGNGKENNEDFKNVEKDPTLSKIKKGKNPDGEFIVGWYVDMMCPNRGGGEMKHDDVKKSGYSKCEIDYTTDNIETRKTNTKCCSEKFNPNNKKNGWQERYDSGNSDIFKTTYLEEVYNWTQEWISTATDDDYLGPSHPCQIFLAHYELGLRECVCSETCSVKSTSGGTTMLEQNMCILLPYAPSPPPFCIACATDAPEVISIIAVPVQQINSSDEEYSNPNSPKIKVTATKSQGASAPIIESKILSKDGEEVTFFDNKATAKLSMPIGVTQMCINGKKQDYTSPEMVAYNEMCYDLPKWQKITDVTSQGSDIGSISFTIPNYDEKGDKNLSLAMNKVDPDTGFEVIGFYGKKDNGTYKIPVTYTCQEIQVYSETNEEIVQEYDATPTADGKGLECTSEKLSPQAPDDLEEGEIFDPDSVVTKLQIIQKIPNPLAIYDKNYDTIMCVKGWKPASTEYFATKDISIRVANNTNQFIPTVNKIAQYCTKNEITKYITPEYASTSGCISYDPANMDQENLDKFKTKDGQSTIFFDNNDRCNYNYQQLINYQFENSASRKTNYRARQLVNSLNDFLKEIKYNREKIEKSNSLTNEEKIKYQEEYEQIISSRYNEFSQKSRTIRSEGGGSTIELSSNSDKPSDCITEQQQKYGLCSDSCNPSDTIIDFSNFHYVSGATGFAPNFDESGLIEIVNPEDFGLCTLVERYIDIPPEVGCVGDTILDIAENLNLPPIVSIDIPGIDAEKCDNPNVEKTPVNPMPILINFDPIKTSTSTLVLDDCEDQQEDATSANTFTCIKKQLLDTYVMDTMQEDGKTQRCSNVYSMLSGSKIGGVGMMSELFVRNGSPIPIRKAPQNINHVHNVTASRSNTICISTQGSKYQFICDQCNNDEDCCLNGTFTSDTVCEMKPNLDEDVCTFNNLGSNIQTCGGCPKLQDNPPDSMRANPVTPCSKRVDKNSCVDSHTPCTNKVDGEYAYCNYCTTHQLECCSWNTSTTDICQNKQQLDIFYNFCAPFNVNADLCTNTQMQISDYCSTSKCIINKFDASYSGKELCNINSTDSFFHNIGVSVSSYNANSSTENMSRIPSMSSSAEDYKFSLCSSPFTYGYFDVTEQESIDNERYLVLVLGAPQRRRGLSYRATNPDKDVPDLYTGIKKPDWKINESMLLDYSGIMNDAILSDADIKIKQKLCGFFNNVIGGDESKIAENMLLTKNFLSYDTTCFASHPFNTDPTSWSIDTGNFQAETNSPFKESIKTRFLHNSHLMTYLFACNDSTLRSIAGLTSQDAIANISSKELDLTKLYNQCKLIQYSGTTQESNYLQLMFPDKTDIVKDGDRKSGALISAISSAKFTRSADFIYDKEIWAPFSMISDVKQSDPLAVGTSTGFLNSIQNSNPALGGFYTANKLCQANSLLPALYQNNANVSLSESMQSLDINMLLKQFSQIYTCTTNPSNAICTIQDHQNTLANGYFKKFSLDSDPKNINILNDSTTVNGIILSQYAKTHLSVPAVHLIGTENSILSETIDSSINNTYFATIDSPIEKVARRHFNFYNNAPSETGSLINQCKVSKPSALTANTDWNWDRYVKSNIVSTGLTKYKYNFLDFFPYVSPGYYVFTSSHTDTDCGNLPELAENSGLTECACKNENKSNVGIDITLNNATVHQSIVQNTYVSAVREDGLPPGFAFMFCVIPDPALLP